MTAGRNRAFCALVFVGAWLSACSSNDPSELILEDAQILDDLFEITASDLKEVVEAK